LPCGLDLAGVDITIDAAVDFLSVIYGIEVFKKGRREEENIWLFVGLSLAPKEYLNLLVFLFWYASP
jgi:hypothetical protein